MVLAWMLTYEGEVLMCEERSMGMGAYIAVGGRDQLIGIVRVAEGSGDVEGWCDVDCAGEVVVGVDGDGGRGVFG